MKNALLVLAMAAGIALLCITAYFAGHAVGVADALNWMHDQIGEEGRFPPGEVGNNRQIVKESIDMPARGSSRGSSQKSKWIYWCKVL